MFREVRAGSSSKVLFAEPALEKGSRIEAWRCMALQVEKISRLIADARAEEMIETHFRQRGQRREGRNVAADVWIVFVGAHHHSGRIPAYDAFNLRSSARSPGYGTCS